MSILRAVLAFAAVAALAAQGADWPQFRGPNADGISPEKLPNKDWKAKPPKELWRISLGDDGYAHPSVAAGKMYIIDHAGGEDVVRAVDVATGKDAWSFKYADTEKANYGFARSTPVFDKGKLYVLGRMGQLHCLDAEKGTKVWARNIKSEFGGKTGSWDYASSPFVDGDKLIVCPGGANASVVALNKDTGKDIWKGGGSDQAGYATPVLATLDGKKQYVVFTGFAVIGVDAASGAQLWSFPWKTSYDVNAATPLVQGNNIFITSNYQRGCAMVKVSGGRAAAEWENKLLQAHFNSPIFSGGHIYGIGDPNKLVCVNPQDGKAAWSQNGFGKGGVAGIDGMLIAVDGSGGDVVLAKLSPAAYEEAGRIKPLGGQSWTAPVISDGRLYIRNKQALVCLDLK